MHCLEGKDTRACSPRVLGILYTFEIEAEEAYHKLRGVAEGAIWDPRLRRRNMG